MPRAQGRAFCTARSRDRATSCVSKKNRPAGHKLLRHEGGDGDHCQAAVLHFRVVKPLEVPAKSLSHFLESQRVETEVAWHPTAPWLVRERVGPQPPLLRDAFNPRRDQDDGWKEPRWDAAKTAVDKGGRQLAPNEFIWKIQTLRQPCLQLFRREPAQRCKHRQPPVFQLRLAVIVILGLSILTPENRLGRPEIQWVEARVRLVQDRSSNCLYPGSG